MNFLFKKHGFGVLFAILVGLIFIFPILLAQQSIGDNYQGVQYTALDDEDIYRTRINEILDGYQLVTSPYLYEYKDSSIVVPPINEWFYALPAFLLGLSGSIILVKFLLPALLFFFVYLLIHRLIEREDQIDEKAPVLIVSLSVALVVTLGVDFVNYTYIAKLLQDGVANPLMWSRLVNPIVGAVQLFGFLLLLEAIVSRRFKYAYVFAGIVLAITVGRYFTLGMSLAVLGSLFLITAYKKEWIVARELIYVGIIGAVLSIWYWINIFSSIGSTEGSLTATRNGMSFTHAPVLNKALLAGTVFVVISAVVVYLRHRTFVQPKSWAFVGAMLLGCWLVFNQQILTGREIWYGHFWQYSVPLIFVAMGVVAYYSWRIITPRIWFWVSIIIMVGTSLYGLFTISQFSSREAKFIHLQGFAPVFNYLNKNAEKDCVVYVRDDGTEELEKLIPAYTSCNVYTTSYNFLGVPLERIEHNFFVDLRMDGVTNENIREYLLLHESEVRGSFCTNWQELFDKGVTPWLLTTIENIEQRYPEFLEENLQDMILKYKIDYIVFEKTDSLSILTELPAFHLSTSTEHYYVYEYIQNYRE